MNAAAISDDQIFDLWLSRDCMDAIRAGDMRGQLIAFVRSLPPPTAHNAAMPDLVSALEKIAENARLASDGDPEEMAMELHDIQKDARAAIAKATGTVSEPA